MSSNAPTTDAALQATTNDDRSNSPATVEGEGAAPAREPVALAAANEDREPAPRRPRTSRPAPRAILLLDFDDPATEDAIGAFIHLVICG